MVGAAGFEPATLWSQTRCATRLRYAPNCLFFILVAPFYQLYDETKAIFVNTCRLLGAHIGG